MATSNRPPGEPLRTRWRRFLDQTGLPPLWLLALLFSGAIGVEVLRAHGLVVPWVQAACVFIIAGAGAAIVGRAHGERARLFLPCLWMIGSVVLGFVALEQWYTQEPLERGFYEWIREGLLADWSFDRLVFGRMAAGRGSLSLSYLLALPVLALPGAFGFAVLRRRELPDQTLRALPPMTSIKFFAFLVAAGALVFMETVVPLGIMLPLLLRPAASIPNPTPEKNALGLGVTCALMLSVMFALLAMNMFSSFVYKTGRSMWEGRTLFIVFVLQVLLILLSLVGSRLARRGALVLAALFPALCLGYALSSGQGLLEFPIKLSGIAAVVLAYMPLSKKDLAAPAAPASDLAAS